MSSNIMHHKIKVKQDRTCRQWSPRPTHARTAVMICLVSLDYEKWGRTDGRTPRANIVITTGRVRVGLGDQFMSSNENILWHCFCVWKFFPWAFWSFEFFFCFVFVKVFSLKFHIPTVCTLLVQNYHLTSHFLTLFLIHWNVYNCKFILELNHNVGAYSISGNSQFPRIAIMPKFIHLFQASSLWRKYLTIKVEWISMRRTSGTRLKMLLVMHHKI